MKHTLRELFLDKASHITGMADAFYLMCQCQLLLSNYLECYSEKVWQKLLSVPQYLFFLFFIVIEFLAGYVFTQDKDYILEPLFS